MLSSKLLLALVFKPTAATHADSRLAFMRGVLLYDMEAVHHSLWLYLIHACSDAVDNASALPQLLYSVFTLLTAHNSYCMFCLDDMIKTAIE